MTEIEKNLDQVVTVIEAGGKVASLNRMLKGFLVNKNMWIHSYVTVLNVIQIGNQIDLDLKIHSSPFFFCQLRPS